MGKTLTFAELPGSPQRRDCLVHVRRDAFERLPEILESDAHLENLGLSWGEVKTIAEGITIAGAPLQVDRAWALRRDITGTLRAARDGVAKTLRITGDHVVTADPALASPELELDFIVRATADGADPAHVCHLASASLAAQGYPYRWVPFKVTDDYAKGVVAVRLTADGRRLLAALTADFL